MEIKIEDIQKEIDRADSTIKIKFIDYIYDDTFLLRPITDHDREIFRALRQLALDSKIRFETPNVFYKFDYTNICREVENEN